MSNERTVSTQELADRMSEHAFNVNSAIEANLSPEVATIVHETRAKTRKALNIKPNDVVVLFGEQAYGLNESPKVLGKRILARDLEDTHGLVPIELFATYDMVGSEGGIYRMQLPHPQSSGGSVSLNVLKGWKNHKYSATNCVRPPTEEELLTMMGTLQGLYGATKASNLNEYMLQSYSTQDNYGDANVDLLMRFEREIGLGISRHVDEGTIDTLIGKNGGIEVMLHIWPLLCSQAEAVGQRGVSVPKYSDTPFQLYHNDNQECGGRIKSVFETDGYQPEMDTTIHCECMQCKARSTTTSSEVVESGRTITWKAIPRVIAYSTLGIADGHITGGGSVYNAPAQSAIESLGIPYFPIANMRKTDDEGNTSAIFKYQSSAVKHGKGGHIKEAELFVKAGKASMVDLALSIGTENLRQSVESVIGSGVTTSTRVYCPEPTNKNYQAF